MLASQTSSPVPSAMQLEDHLGEIIRKGREAANSPVTAAAKAAGLDVNEYDAFEKSGHLPGPANLQPLAGLIGLDAAKLQKIAAGWLPPSIDLGAWREIRVITTTQEGIKVHCYIVWDEVSREAAVFDTGWDAQPIIDLISEQQVQLKHLFLTHMDEDHVAAMAKLREFFPKLHLHTNSKNAPPQHRNRANDFLHLGSLRITNRETPG